MADVDRVFPGDSEMARRMREVDWAATPLGPASVWPQTLQIALGICLMSRFPTHVLWGPSLTLFYNDACSSLLGPGRHPAVLGRSGREAWAEIWDQIGPLIDRVQTEKDGSSSENIRMTASRDRTHEEVYATFSFSPILGPTGIVEGVFCASMETTEKILGNRRTETLLARDLRDALGQQIMALRVTLDLIASMTSASPGALPALVEQSCAIADRLEGGLEALTWDMHPATIATLGLSAAVRGYVADWSRQVGVDAEVTVEGLHDIALRGDAELQLYRLLQEALRNVHKHADARHVSVLLQRVNADVRLLVEDDGHGFDVPAALASPAAGGAGLLTMRDRVRQIGGVLDIESSRETGTTVFIRVPLP